MIKIYAAAVMARKPNQQEILGGQGFLTGTNLCVASGCILANSPQEAEGLALAEARKKYPPSQGWQGHAAHITEVPRQYIDAVV